MPRYPEIHAYDSFPAYLADCVVVFGDDSPKTRLALALRVTRPFLSMMLAGRRQPSFAVLFRLAELAAWGPAEVEYGFALAAAERCRDRADRASLARRMERLRPAAASDAPGAPLDPTLPWCAFAILEMVDLADFSADPAWIAARLGRDVTAAEAESATNDLLGRGLLARNDHGQLVRARHELGTSHNIPSRAIRSLHREMLRKARHALENRPVKERTFLGHILTIDSARLPEAQAQFSDFLANFSAAMNQPGGDQTYHLGLQFFSLTSHGDQHA